MAEPARRSLLFSTCSLLMSAIFAYSASVQRDDADWYLWLPLYAAASAVNLLRTGTMDRPFRTAARAALLLGVALFIKVVTEGYVYGAAGLLSLDIRERVVREKLGSGLVAFSMLLHLETSPSTSGKKPKLRSYIDYCGMATILAVSLGLCIRFFVFHKPEMRR